MPRFVVALLLIAAITPIAKAGDDPAQVRAKELKAGIKTFRLQLNYNGDEDKPFYRLTLRVGAVEQSGPFQRLVSITEEQAGKIIDQLAGDGFLARAADKQKRPQPTMPGYTRTVGNFTEDLGWGLPMLKRLDGLRKVLEGDAAKEMDLLLGRLSGFRKLWENEGAASEKPKVGPAGEWKKLYADQQWYKNHRQPEQVFTGTLERHKEPEMSILMRPHRYKLGDRFLYPGKEHPDLEKLVGQKVEVRGKPYDVELEGQAVSEIWPAVIRAAAAESAVEKPDQQKKVQEVAAELGGKVYPECIWVGGVYIDLHDQKVTDVGLERLKRFAEIRGLNLVGTQITDAGLKHLTDSANLRRLELNKTQITGTGLEHIKSLPQLEKLFLKETQVTDTGLKHLKGLPKLALLDLGGTKITEAGLADLKDMPQLNTIHLSRNQLTEPMLKRLKELPKIKTLGVYNSDDEGVDDLKKALPDCTVEPLQRMPWEK